MTAGTESAEWVRQEMACADLSDKRLDRRLMKTAEHLAQSPSSPINEACGTWAGTQAAYRLFNNPKASPAKILKPHWEATAARMAGCGGPVLVMQDTVFFSYGRHVKTRGLGPIGKSNAAHDRGLIMHNALAFTTQGVPLGILSQSIWARREVPVEDYQEKIERLQVTAIEEKESAKWLVALKLTLAMGPGTLPVGLDGQEGGEHRQALAAGQGLIAPPPVCGLALDHLAVGVVPARIAHPMHPIGHEVEPQLLGAHPGLVHNLHLQALPIGKRIIVQR